MSLIEAAKGIFKRSVKDAEVLPYSKEAQKKWNESLVTATTRTKIVANAYKLHLPHDMQPDQFDYMRIHTRLTYLIATKTQTPEERMDQKALKLRHELAQMHERQKHPLRVSVVPDGCSPEAIQASYDDQIHLVASTAMRYYEGLKSIDEYEVPSFVANTMLQVNMMHQLKKGAVRVL